MLSSTCIPRKNVAVTRRACEKLHRVRDGAEVRLPPSYLNLCTRVSMLGEQHCCHFCISVLHRKNCCLYGLEESELIVCISDDASLMGCAEFAVVFLI